MINGKVYISSAKEFKERGRSHLRSLEKRKHHNKHLQAVFNKDGTDNFVFEILKVVNGSMKKRRLVEERYLKN